MTFRGARRHSLFDIRDCAVATSWAIERVEGSSFPCGESCKQASSATRGRKEHFCDRHHIASATAALRGFEMFGGL